MTIFGQCYNLLNKRHIRNGSTNQIAGNSLFSSEIILIFDYQHSFFQFFFQFSRLKKKKKKCLYFSSFRCKARVTKSKQVLVARIKRGEGHGPRRPKCGQWKLGRECDSLLDRVLAFCKQRNMQNTLFYEEICGKNYALHVHLTYKVRCRSLWERIILLKSLPNEQSFCSFSRYNKLSHV